MLIDKKQKAKEVLIESMYPDPDKLRILGNKVMGPCPFHKDSNPSFLIFRNDNKWKCFAGCGYGDSIDFYMRMHKVDFKQALEELIKK